MTTNHTYEKLVNLIMIYGSISEEYGINPTTENEKLCITVENKIFEKLQKALDNKC